MSSPIDSAHGAASLPPNYRKMNLKAQLRFYLDKRGMSAAELARKAGVSKQVLSLWSGGAKPKNIDQAKRVAIALGTTLDNLMFGNGVDDASEKATELDALLGTGWVSGLFEVRFRRVRK